MSDAEITCMPDSPAMIFSDWGPADIVNAKLIAD